MSELLESAASCAVGSPVDTGGLQVSEVRDAIELQSLETSWRSLLSTSPSETIFLSWEWMNAWWGAYGASRALRVFTATDAAGNLRGIAPMQMQTMRRYGQSVRTLSLLGDGSNDSDYLDFIVARGYEAQVVKAFVDYWRSELDAGTVLLLNEVPETSPNLDRLRRLAASGRAIWTEEDVPCGTVRLPATWDEYLKLLRPRFRTKVRSVLRQLEGRPEVSFGFCGTHEQVDLMLPVLYDLHTRRWAQDGKPGVFGWDRKRSFYSLLSRRLLDADALRFSWLAWNGCILACQYGFVRNGTYFHLQEGYEPSSEHLNVGIGLRAWSIREFLKAGIVEYDFLGGIGRHKTDWGAEVKRSKRIQMAVPAYRTTLFCRGPEWGARARETVKQMVPQPVLNARRRWLDRSAVTVSIAHSQEPWVRKAAAQCYYRSCATRLVSPLCNRYQLAVQAPGGRRRISKRTEPAARILYYHRVNDDADPFFPAISTRLFDQEMRYIAQHYKVVSMSALLDHLQSGSPEAVLAITFDDGYDDNYLNAFPILARYNLPATIFLTTGNLDSGEPMWFERLADAVRNTTREFLDVEFDIPRRFWMRTAAERLHANDSIFAWLRQQPDSDRRTRLEEILRQLAAGEPARHGRMLTWNQVREMHRAGIDFGGHTVTHPFISKLKTDQIAWEAGECKRRIEEELQACVDHFAYPNGREEDYGGRNTELLRQAGYKSAVTTVWGMNYSLTDPMQLRRGGPWENSAAMFAYKLDWYQLVND